MTVQTARREIRSFVCLTLNGGTNAILRTLAQLMGSVCKLTTFKHTWHAASVTENGKHISYILWNAIMGFV